jgi:hypothetical protein
MRFPAASVNSTSRVEIGTVRRFAAELAVSDFLAPLKKVFSPNLPPQTLEKSLDIH